MGRACGVVGEARVGKHRIKPGEARGYHRHPAVSSGAVGALAKLRQLRAGTGLVGGPALPPGPLHCLMRHPVPPFQRALITPFL